MFCKNCGKELKDGALFCGGCGAKMETNPQPERAAEIPQPPPMPEYTSSAPAQNTEVKNTAPAFLKWGILAVFAVIIIVVGALVVNKIINKNKFSVDYVKSCYLYYFSKDTTIGEIFSDYSYFSDISWDEFKGEKDDGEKVDVVEFNAEIDMLYITSDDEEYVTEDITFQFYHNDDMGEDESEIYGIFIDDTISLDDYDIEDILDCIYNDEMFYFVASDYIYY